MTEQELVEVATLRIERPAGGVARVELPIRDGDDLWSAIDRAYPQAYDLLNPQDIETPREGEFQRWDVSFRPGEGEDLAAWFVERSE